MKKGDVNNRSEKLDQSVSSFNLDSVSQALYLGAKGDDLMLFISKD